METKLLTRELSHILRSERWPLETMLFIAGPRQCGKTTLARSILEERDSTRLYFNWDVETVRRRYRQDPDFMAKEAASLNMEKPTIVIDEIHKLTRWKNILKGFYDEYNELFDIIVTGSARLDLFRRSGDSLVGRYTLMNLFPFSLREINEESSKEYLCWLNEEDDWKDLSGSLEAKLADSKVIPGDIAAEYLKFGPFPVPLLSGSEKRSRKWHRDYLTLITREDLRDLSGIRELDRVSHLIELLPHRVGSPLSLRNLTIDLEANHSTIQNWLQALNRLYLIWPLRPFSGKIQRTIRKEPKWYFLDWTYAANSGSQFENLVASSLLRFVTSLSDLGWPEVKLHYLRTYDKKEIDFVLVRDNQPILAIEAKLGSDKIPSQLIRFRQAYNDTVPIIQVVNQPGLFLKKGDGKYVVGFDRLLMIL